MPKILLIEDDEQLARFLMRFLNSEGYSTDYANGQKDGLRLHYTSEAIVNLLKNAIEHTPEGGTVTVTAKGSNIAAEITITDTGEGIPEAELSHISKRFYRSSEYAKNGFGIGLT